MRIGVTVGTRPEIVKMWPIISTIESDSDLDLLLIHTGQHYDYEMSRAFFDKLEVRTPDYFLETGGTDSHIMLGSILKKMVDVLAKEKMDIMLVQGDTISTLATALACSLSGIPIGHIEAGCRSFDNKMIEETNRKIVDVIADVLFAPTKTACVNLLKEGRNRNDIFLVGSTTNDALKQILSQSVSKPNKYEKPYLLTTIHRKENADDPKRLEEILLGLDSLSIKCVFPIHPRTKKMIKKLGLNELIQENNIEMIDPLNYSDFIQLLSNASVVLTDSGGVQEEAALLGINTLTIRPNTEWPETVWFGKNKLIRAERDEITRMVNEALKGDKDIQYREKYEDVGQTIIQILKELYRNDQIKSKSLDMTKFGYPTFKLTQNETGSIIMGFDKQGFIVLDDDNEYAVLEDYRKLEFENADDEE